ncbi:MAG: hypothetical protein ACLS9K_10965 [Lachnospira eligens]
MKDDLSESVNNLPDDTNKASDDSDDVMVNTLDDPELAKMAEAFKMEARNMICQKILLPQKQIWEMCLIKMRQKKI